MFPLDMVDYQRLHTKEMEFRIKFMGTEGRFDTYAQAQVVKGLVEVVSILQ
jgi:hypothetical protein